MDVDFAKQGGLVPAVAQDARTGEVLTLAYMNEEALRATRETGLMHYWSRSRNKLWRKGEESGNVQRVVSLSLDCDGDAVLAKVEPAGPACHTGAVTCFHEPLHGEGGVVLEELLRVIDERRAAPPGAASHTAKLFASENLRLKKVVEEAGEVLMAAKDHDKERLAEELADLLFHALVVMRAEDVAWRDVMGVLARRRAKPAAGGAQ